MRNRALPEALLIHAWNEYPAAQLKLLAWLRDLAGGAFAAKGADLIRRAKVAWAVGTARQARLRHRVSRRSWSAGSEPDRQAGWEPATDSRLVPRGGCAGSSAEQSCQAASSNAASRGPDQAQLMAAATAYGDRIAGISLREALDGLSRMARYLHQHSPLSDALRQLCADGEAAAVLDELARSARRTDPLTTAAASVVGWLAYIPGYAGPCSAEPPYPGPGVRRRSHVGLAGGTQGTTQKRPSGPAGLSGGWRSGEAVQPKRTAVARSSQRSLGTTLPVTG